MTGTEITWALIKDNFEQARSHEEMREKTVTLTMTISSILVASLAIDGFAESPFILFGAEFRFSLIVGVILIGLGVFGALCSQKHYERNRMHIKLAQKYLAKLGETDDVDYPFDVSAAFTEHTNAKDWKGAWAERVKLNLLWTGFPVFIAVLGGVIAFGSSKAAENPTAEHDGADQPATTVESKPMSDSQPKPEPEGRAQ